MITGSALFDDDMDCVYVLFPFYSRYEMIMKNHEKGGRE